MSFLLKLYLFLSALTFAYVVSEPTYVIIKNTKSPLVATETAEKKVTVNTYKQGDENQLWILKPAPNDTVFIVNKVSGLAIEKDKNSSLLLTKPLCQCEEPTVKTTIKPGKATGSGSGGKNGSKSGSGLDFFHTGFKKVFPKQNECECKGKKPWPVNFVEKTISYAENGSLVEAVQTTYKDVTSKKSECQCNDQQVPTKPVEETHPADNKPPTTETPPCKCQHQQWRINSSEQIIANVENGRVLDIQDGSLKDGKPLIAYRANGEPNQSFITETV